MVIVEQILCQLLLADLSSSDRSLPPMELVPLRFRSKCATLFPQHTGRKTLVQLTVATFIPCAYKEVLILDPRFWMLCLSDMRWMRNQVVAPLTEELVFRACMLPMLIPCAGLWSAIFTCPLFFGVAHFHHVIELLRFRQGTLSGIFLSAVFQFSYTAVFGAYTAFIFVRTGMPGATTRPGRCEGPEEGQSPTWIMWGPASWLFWGPWVEGMEALPCRGPWSPPGGAPMPWDLLPQHFRHTRKCWGEDFGRHPESCREDSRHFHHAGAWPSKECREHLVLIRGLHKRGRLHSFSTGVGRRQDAQRRCGGGPKKAFVARTE
ncbi:FACE2 protease, partial [Polypterus senegalus]